MAGPDRSDRPGGGLTEEAPGPSHVSIFSIGFRATNQRIAPAILDLVDSGTVRVIDALFVSKNSDGVVTTLEVSDLDGVRTAAGHGAVAERYLRVLAAADRAHPAWVLPDLVRAFTV